MVRNKYGMQGGWPICVGVDKLPEKRLNIIENAFPFPSSPHNPLTPLYRFEIHILEPPCRLPMLSFLLRFLYLNINENVLQPDCGIFWRSPRVSMGPGVGCSEWSGIRGGLLSGWLRSPVRFPFDKITYCLLGRWALQKGLSLKFYAQQKETLAPFCCLPQVTLLLLLLSMRHHAHLPPACHPLKALLNPPIGGTWDGSEVVRNKQFTELDKVTCAPSAFGGVEAGFVTISRVFSHGPLAAPTDWKCRQEGVQFHGWLPAGEVTEGQS